ncbi:MAG TPA: hypothetical protein VF011_04195 [Terriglobales bacterium]
MRRRRSNPGAVRERDRVQALHVLARMRRTGSSLASAARSESISPQKVLKSLPGELRKSGSRWIPTRPTDRQPRQMNLLDEKGRRVGTVRGSKAASLLGRYNAALSKFFSGNGKYAGDESLLDPFRGKRVAGVTLLTDTKALIELAEAGELSFDDLYAAPYGGSE